jgi:sigma-E factor negative regulatory protein RseB
VTLVWCALLALLGPPALATPVPVDRADGKGEVAALRLLERAAAAARSVSYAGTQYVASWSATASNSALAEVAYDPVRGAVVTLPRSAGQPADASVTVGPAGLEEQLVDVLAEHYLLRVAGDGRCAGRDAQVVEAARPGVRGQGTVAGRFWLDRESGLVLRREVYDDAGRTVRSSAFIDLVVTLDPDRSPDDALPPSRVDEGTEDLQQLRGRGWNAPDQLPGGFTLFDVDMSGDTLPEDRPSERDDQPRLVHLSYSDGLSTLSLFVQQGQLGAGPGGAFRRATMDGAPVWVHPSTPERVVWSGGDRVWTLVSDAPSAAVHAAAAALPHDRAPRDGVLARLGRGLKRMGSMLNPFG